MSLKTLAVKLAVLPAIMGLAFAANNLTAEEKVQTIEIHVDQEDNNDAQVELIIDGKTESFVLEKLMKGESKTIVTESGNTIVATKDLEGNTTINMDGKEIQLFQFQGDMGSNFNFIHADDENAPNFISDQIMILGGGLSDEVKEALKATLASYNIDKKVVFTDQSNTNMMFISKEVLDSSGSNIELNNLHGKRIKIIKEVEKD